MSLDFSQVDIAQVQQAIAELKKFIYETDIKILESTYGKNAFNFATLTIDHDMLELSKSFRYTYTLDPIITNVAHYFDDQSLSNQVKCLTVIFYCNKITTFCPYANKTFSKEFLDEVDAFQN